jgi:hypothetical protein
MSRMLEQRLALRGLALTFSGLGLHAGRNGVSLGSRNLPQHTRAVNRAVA